jgi:uncharacterized protein (TIGR02145 family)
LGNAQTIEENQIQITMKIQTLLTAICLILMGNCQKDDNNDNTVTDIDGNIYHTVKIGTKVWMVENLKTTKYLNGDPIPNVIDNTEWENTRTGAYSDYDNSSGNSTIYGRLYNYYAVVDSCQLCPTGWHVPSDEEWTILTTYLGGEDIAGGKLKAKGTTYWLSPNTGATNESGFTALPGGYRIGNGQFEYIGHSGWWWTITEFDEWSFWLRAMVYGHTMTIRTFYGSTSGLSIRCVQD